MWKTLSIFVGFTVLVMTGCTMMGDDSQRGRTAQRSMAQDGQPAHGMGRSMTTKAMGPADGYMLHVTAPHQHEDGTIGGPYHHYCKGVSEQVYQCLLFESPDPNALLVGVEYFIAKSVSRENVPLAVWNKYYHDHAREIATGRVQVLDLPEDQAKAVAQAASQTDGIIFRLWPKQAKAPNGDVAHDQAVGHQPLVQP